MHTTKYLSPEYGLLEVEFEVHVNSLGHKYVNIVSAHNEAGVNMYPLAPLEEADLMEKLIFEINEKQGD